MIIAEWSIFSRKARQIATTHLWGPRVLMEYRVPLSEVLVDFYDQLKARTQGYASMDYSLADYLPGNLVRVDILVNGEPVDALSLIAHRDSAYYQGRDLVSKLKELIPRQQFEVPIQASIGSRVVARETIKALRKNVTAKLLRRRRDSKAQAAGKAGRGQKAHEACGSSRDTSRSLP